MTVTYGFFNSLGGDRRYDALDFGRLFDGIMTDGVHRGIGTEFSVEPTTGLNITVGAGRAWFNSTWTINDAPVIFSLEGSEVTLNRIDSIVLEVDTNESVRANTIRIIKGTPAATPVVTPVIRSENLNQYLLHSVYRKANSTTITAGDITKYVGTPDCPYVTSRLLRESVDPAIMHRNTFRGNNLGSTVTSEQRTAIQNGSFENLYVGDYWTINGVNWRIADIDYYLNKGPTLHNGANRVVTKHHLVIMPDASLNVGKMQNSDSKNNAGAYLNADCRKTGGAIPGCHTIVNSAFGTNNKLGWYQLYTTALSSGMASSVDWGSASLEIPNMQMIFGSTMFIPHGRGEKNPPSYSTESASQLALFRLAPQYMTSETSGAGRTYWLRDVISPTMWAVVGSSGELTKTGGANTFGFRPYFLLN